MLGFRQHWFDSARYLQLNKTDKGVLLSFMQKLSGYSRIQVKQYCKTGRIQRRQRTTHGFPRKYIDEAIRLLARTDELYGTLSGPTTKTLCERACNVFDQQEYRQLAGISVTHLYNLRRSRPYSRVRHHFEKTCPPALQHRGTTQAPSRG